MNKRQILYLLLGSFIIAGTWRCQYNGPESNYNALGVWHGQFNGEQGTNISFVINITGQNTDPITGNDRLYGTWSYAGGNGYIEGSTYYSYALWGSTYYKMNLTLHTYNRICCDLFSGCSSEPYVGYERLFLATGVIENNSINNENARYVVACTTIEDGRYTLSKS